MDGTKEREYLIKDGETIVWDNPKEPPITLDVWKKRSELTEKDINYLIQTGQWVEPGYAHRPINHPYTPEEGKRFLENLRKTGTVYKAALEIGVPVNDIARWRGKFPDFAIQVQEVQRQVEAERALNEARARNAFEEYKKGEAERLRLARIAAEEEKEEKRRLKQEKRERKRRAFEEELMAKRLKREEERQLRHAPPGKELLEQVCRDIEEDTKRRSVDSLYKSPPLNKTEIAERLGYANSRELLDKVRRHPWIEQWLRAAKTPPGLFTAKRNAGYLVYPGEETKAETP